VQAQTIPRLTGSSLVLARDGGMMIAVSAGTSACVLALPAHSLHDAN
jgi:hypothetical protein